MKSKTAIKISNETSYFIKLGVKIKIKILQIILKYY